MKNDTTQKRTFLIINGPNLNMLGKRDASHYGTFTLADVEAAVRAKADALGVDVRFFQSGCEGEIIAAVHEAADSATGIVINAGAYTHYSYAILDALLAAKLPAMEVHISDIHKREAFRRVSVIQPACVGQICGLGIESYTLGLERLATGEFEKTPAKNVTDMDALRTEISACDAELMRVFNQRMALAARVAESKASSGKAVYDAAREDAVIAHCTQLAGPQNAGAAEVLMRTVMRLSRERQYALIAAGKARFDGALGALPRAANGSLANIRRVAFGGQAGSFSEAGARALFPDAELRSARTFEDACKLVEDGECDAAALPVANTAGGHVDTVYRLLQGNLSIVKAVEIPVCHCLCAPAGVTLGDVKTVVSHPQALAQCSRIITENGWRTRTVENTAYAPEDVRMADDTTCAAICSAEAARAAGFEILVENVCDTRSNRTRFVAATRGLIVTPDASRLSLLLHLPHTHGALAAALAGFADYGLNLASISAQPVPDRPWEYAFFLDIDAPALDNGARMAIFGLSQELPFLRIVGWYNNSLG